MMSSARHDPVTTPVVWMVLADKQGDNAQVDIVAQALPWPVIRKYVQVRQEFAIKKPAVRAALDHIDLEQSDALKTPWPNLILTVGRRPAMVALWIKQQSSGNSKIILFGKPSSRVSDYDLIISSSEILMPPFSNIVNIQYPLMRIDSDAIQHAATEWNSRLSQLPKPLIAIMIGGPTKPYVYDLATADTVIKQAQDINNRQQGTAYLVTSRRTPKTFIQQLRSRLPENCQLHIWNTNQNDNPYKALLGSADGFMVTEDSISMMIEVAKLGKPLTILPLSTRLFGKLDRYRRQLTGKLFSRQNDSLLDSFRICLVRIFYHIGVIRQVRDYRAFQQHLFQQGHAVRVGQTMKTPEKPLTDNLSDVVTAIVSYSKQDS